jgi:hypothetical protein
VEKEKGLNVQKRSEKEKLNPKKGRITTKAKQ